MPDPVTTLANPSAEADCHPIGMDILLAYQKTVFLICLGFSHNQWDAQELAQEAYLQAQKRLHQLRQPDAAKAWICRLTRNLCLDHLRAQRWRRFLGLEEVKEQSHNMNPAILLEMQEQICLVKKAIRQLPQKLREVFVLRTYAELSYDEIAQTLSLNPGTVMSRLSRARTLVKKGVEEGGYHE
jgi:RNA polymerase sigma-70 factor, ECF subfamily